MRTSLRLIAAAVLPAALLGTAACGADEKAGQQARSCPTSPAAPGLAVAVGAHANSPAPAWPGQLDGAVTAVLDAPRGQAPRTGVTLVRVDGRPSLACVMTYGSKAKNQTAENHNRDRFRAAVRAMVTRTAAVEPESDPLEALALAAAAAGPGGTVALIDSGLQTTAPLDFRRPGLLAADPDTVVAALARNGQLPDLHGRTVLLDGIGYTTAPQAPLDENRRTHLIELWQKIATRAGAASVDFVVAPNTTPSAPGLPAVAPVTVPPAEQLDLGCNTEVAFPDSGPVGFRADSTDFADPGAAHRALGTIARWLTRTGGARAEVIGSIAHHGADDGGHGLSRDRAQRVRSVLVEEGADPGQLTAAGVGWGPFPSKSAGPDPVSDGRNRRVVVRLLCG